MKVTTTNNRIRMMLLQMGVDPSNLGYKYLLDGIGLAYSDRAYIDNMSSMLYAKVAEINGTTKSAAERSMRHSVETLVFPAETDTNYAIICHASERKLTNSQFISYCVEFLKMEDEENAE